MANAQNQMSGGYDISQSTSESATQGYSVDFGGFNNGGGLRLPKWFWPAVVILAAIWLLKRK